MMASQMVRIDHFFLPSNAAAGIRNHVSSDALNPGPFEGGFTNWATALFCLFSWHLMGSLHRQVAVLVPDEKVNCFDFGKKKLFKTKRDYFYPGPVETPSWWWLPIDCVIFWLKLTNWNFDESNSSQNKTREKCGSRICIQTLFWRFVNPGSEIAAENPFAAVVT